MGYVASSVETEDEISEGLVISQGTEAVTDDNVTTALTSRNQFVWIPVPDINSMVMCKENNTTTGVGNTKICNIVLENGELKCTVHNTTGATNMCSRLYNSSAYNSSTNSNGYKIKATSMDFNLKTQTFSQMREPDIITDFDIESFTRVCKSI